MQTYKLIGNHRYKWAGSRSTKAQANRLKKLLDDRLVVTAEVRERKLGGDMALVPTVYDVWVRPFERSKASGYTLTSKRLENLIRDCLNRA